MVKISSLCANWSVSKCVGGVGNEAFDKQIQVSVEGDNLNVELSGFKTQHKILDYSTYIHAVKYLSFGFRKLICVDKLS